MPSLIKLNHDDGIISCSAPLPASKSECNRALILQALSNGQITVENISEARDTETLQRLLNSNEEVADVIDAGTTLRFLLAYYCVTGQSKILTGSHRMKERPIGPLVEALRALGFSIAYLDQEGYPPIQVVPVDKSLLNKEVSITGSVSSQYISALLLIGAAMPKGVEVSIKDKLLSRPYVEMTRELLQRAGISSVWKNETTIIVPPQGFQETILKVESDWSAASYFYSMAALAQEAKLCLKGLKLDSLQGDARIASLMTDFGVETTYLLDGVLLSKGHRVNPPSEIDFSDMPDLCQTVAVLCAAKNIPIKFKGLKSLRIKETDRIAALQAELKKCNVNFLETGEDLYELSGKYIHPTLPIASYHDHRMAMSFSPLALLGEVTIESPDVVTKSYPHFWEVLKKCEFNVATS